MKKLLLIAFLISSLAYTQNQGTKLSAPVTTEIDSILLLSTGQRVRHVPYTNLRTKLETYFDTQYAPVGAIGNYTAGDGLTLTGTEFKLGGTYGSNVQLFGDDYFAIYSHTTNQGGSSLYLDENRADIRANLLTGLSFTDTAFELRIKNKTPIVGQFLAVESVSGDRAFIDFADVSAAIPGITSTGSDAGGDLVNGIGVNTTNTTGVHYIKTDMTDGVSIYSDTLALKIEVDNTFNYNDVYFERPTFFNDNADYNQNRITDLGVGINPTDAMPMQQVLDSIAAVSALSNPLSQNMDAGGYFITNVGTIQGVGNTAYTSTGFTSIRANNDVGIHIDDDNNNSSHDFYVAKDGLGVGGKLFNVDENGTIDFNEYGDGTKTGTATYALGVDANGNVIEISVNSSDNLGNHTATQNVNMGGNEITNALNITATNFIYTSGLNVSGSASFGNNRAELVADAILDTDAPNWGQVKAHVANNSGVSTTYNIETADFTVASSELFDDGVIHRYVASNDSITVTIPDDTTLGITGSDNVYLSFMRKGSGKIQTDYASGVTGEYVKHVADSTKKVFNLAHIGVNNWEAIGDFEYYTIASPSVLPSFVSGAGAESATNSIAFSGLTPTTGNVLFASISVQESVNFNTPTGWTLISEIDGAYSTFALLYKVSDGTETAPTFTNDGAGGQTMYGQIIEFTGVNTTTPYTSLATTGEVTSNPLTINALTSSNANSLAVSFVQFQRGSGTFDSITTAPTNYVERYSSWTNSGGDAWHLCYTQDVAAAGAIAADSISFANQENLVTFNLVLNPE